MNGEQKIDALLGNGNDTPNGGQSTDELKARVAELERELAKAKVEQGRVSKLNAQKKALEDELAKYREGRSAQKLASEYHDAENDGIPKEYVNMAASMASKAADSAVEEARRRMEAERKAEQEANHERKAKDLVALVESKYPKFLSSIGPGGDKQQAWASFLVNNRDSVNRAFSELNIDMLSYHINRFYNEVLGIRPPQGTAESNPAADPTSSRRGNQSLETTAGKVYTAAEYDALEKKALELRKRGDYEGYRKLDEELNSALAENRVKD